MQKFEAKLPHVIFGEGSSKRIGNLATEYGSKKMMAVFDKGVFDAGIVTPIIDSLRGSGVETIEFSDVVPDPRDVDVNKGAAKAREEGVDSIIAIGGGSSIDTAKGIWVLISNPGHDDILDFAYGTNGKAMGYSGPKGLFIAVPTTSGTGSDVSSSALITDTKGNEKASIGGFRIVPTISILDPDLDVALPASQTAATGMDALCHCLESYTVGGAKGSYVQFSDWTDMVGLTGVKIITKYLPMLAKDLRNKELRAKIKYGAFMGGIAETSGGLNLGHGIAHTVGAMWHIPHGVACSWGIIANLRHGAKQDGAEDRYRNLMDACGITQNSNMNIRELTDSLVKYMIDLAKSLGIPTFKELGKSEDEWMDKVMAGAKSRGYYRVCTEDEVREYYHELFNIE